MTGSKGLIVSCLLSIFADKQDRANKMNQHNSFDTLTLLHTHADGLHLIYHNAFRLMRPTRRKYKIKCNELLLLNGIYLFNKYSNAVFARYHIQKYTGYFNQGKFNYYFDILLKGLYIEEFSIIRGIQYYRITLAGLDVINYFNSTYQEQLSKWLQDHKIEL